MLYKYGKRARQFLGAFLFPFQSRFLQFLGVFNRAIIPLALVGYEMIIPNSALRASLAIYHLISNAHGIIVKYIIVKPYAITDFWIKKVGIALLAQEKITIISQCRD